MVENGGSLPLSFDAGGGAEEAKDFTVDDLVLLKEILLNLETAIDNIPMQSSLAGHGETFEGVYMFDLLAKVNVCALLFVLFFSSEFSAHFQLFYIMIVQ